MCPQQSVSKSVKFKNILHKRVINNNGKFFEYFEMIRDNAIPLANRNDNVNFNNNNKGKKNYFQVHMNKKVITDLNCTNLSDMTYYSDELGSGFTPENYMLSSLQSHCAEEVINDSNLSSVSDRPSRLNESENCVANLRYASNRYRDMHCQSCNTANTELQLLNNSKTANKKDISNNGLVNAVQIENAPPCEMAALGNLVNIVNLRNGKDTEISNNNNNGFNNNKLYRIFDINSKQLFLIDTGSTVSIIKASAEDKKDPIAYLTAANGSQIKVYNSVNAQINLLLRRGYTHKFLVADVVENILGLDFFTKYKFFHRF